MKVSDLIGASLDYWVCMAELAEFEGRKLDEAVIEQIKAKLSVDLPYRPSCDWRVGGPIIERERIAFFQTWHEGHVYFSEDTRWTACTNGTSYTTEVEGDAEARGPSQLIAAMRAYVASKFGDEVSDMPM